MSNQYQGNCHCGAVSFTVTGPFNMAAQCDCSICTRKNAVMVMVDKENITIDKGADNLTEYKFNTKVAAHYFCKTCGIYTHHKKRRDDNFGFNLGCVDGLSMDDIPEFVRIEGSAFSTVDS